jgi:glutaredoxin
MRKVVTVVSKEGCHLCERVVEALTSLSSRYDLEVRVLDISHDAKLADKYLLSIPVVQIEGKDVFDGRDMTADGGFVGKLEQVVVRS